VGYKLSVAAPRPRVGGPENSTILIEICGLRYATAKKQKASGCILFFFVLKLSRRRKIKRLHRAVTILADFCFLVAAIERAFEL